VVSGVDFKKKAGCGQEGPNSGQNGSKEVFITSARRPC
jgi:hypothetical protein